MNKFKESQRNDCIDWWWYKYFASAKFIALSSRFSILAITYSDRGFP